MPDELDHRLKLLSEFATALARRAEQYVRFAAEHPDSWRHEWQLQRAERYRALGRALADPACADFIRGHVGLRDLFSRDLPPPKRPPPKYRHRPVEEPWILLDPTKLAWPKP
jgi:hypothetical protein